MTKIEQIERKLDLNDRISVSALDKKTKQFFPSCFLLIFAVHVLPFLVLPKSISVAAASSLSLVVSWYFLYKLRRSLSSAALKGDSLILNNISKKNCVTSIRSIRKIKTKRIGNTMITALHYNLDGTMRRAVLVSNTKHTKHPSPSEVIRSAQRYFKNKRQIYKPGSVS